MSRTLQAQVAALRALIHAQSRRWTPGLSPAEVDDMIERAVAGHEPDPRA